jgi:hypothetical protein
VSVSDADVLAVLSTTPMKVVDLALLLVPGAPSPGQVPAAFLAQQGLSLSAVQKLVDGLVRDGRAVELSGKALWDERHPGLGPDARGRHFILAAPTR